MRTIAVEEHFTTKEFQDTITKRLGGPAPVPPHMVEIFKRQLDLGVSRIHDMDEAGIDMQVLSLSALGLEALDAETAIPLVRDCNDVLADAVKSHPDRFAGFAHLALQDPESAAAELERCVNRLGLCGAMVSGMTNGKFLDDAVFQPILATAEQLGVPIYLHPASPPPAVYEAYFSGLPQGVGSILSMSGWGWHAENALHSLRLVASGVFDKFPKLQLMIGHMGEGIPFFLARIEEKLGPITTYLDRRVPESVELSY